MLHFKWLKVKRSVLSYMAKNLSEAERYKIEGYLKAGIKPDEIAKLLGRCRATIYNEIKRGTCTQLDSELREYKTYLADAGERVHNERAAEKGRPPKIGNDMEFVRHVEHMTNNENYSPFAIIADIENRGLDFKTKVCERTLYNYLKNGTFLNIKAKSKQKHEKKRKVSLNNLKGRSIEERPEHIKDREEYGHWEMDTVVSGQGKSKACLLVLTERAFREEIIIKMENKKAESTVKALNSLERKLGAVQFRKIFKTITVDNGVEFLDFQNMEKSVINKKLKRTTIYYCHPFCSSERGSNENQNRLIRKFIPKGYDISQYTDEDIQKIQDWMNNYPRKILGGKSANMLKKELAT